MASLSGESTNANCDACAAGYGCRVPNIRMDCSAGFYCTGSAITSRPNEPSSQGGGMCGPGYYCTTSQVSQTACTAGYYCPNFASNLQVACPSGYYCPSTGAISLVDTPTKFLLCPTGYYCPLATVTPMECGEGYYSQSSGASA
jgi:hypothetical protein